MLGVLVEKQHTVPDAYPLTLNALVAGCNQKSSREPVLEASETEVQAAVDHLRMLSLVIESSGGRVMRYAHNVPRVLEVPTQAAALIATLMLRGPQTVGELRINSERLHRFADVSATLAFLRELEARPAGALVAELSRQPGARETRWMHLLSGAPAASAPLNGEPAVEREGRDLRASDEVAALRADLTRVQAELAELKAVVSELSAALRRPD